MVLNDPVWKHFALKGKDGNRHVIAPWNWCARTFSLKVGHACLHRGAYGKMSGRCNSRHVDFAPVSEQFELARGQHIAAVVAGHRRSRGT